MYDAIIIGARCAGSPTAMLLARRGYKVLLLDKAEFPSETISTHIIFPAGVERLKRWGLLDNILSSDCPIIHQMGLDLGIFTLRGFPPVSDSVPGIIAPRRRILDKILCDAAVKAGAELRENSLVEEVVMDNGRVTGVRCHTKSGASFTENARIVIGADGRNSIVARTVKAEGYNVVPALTCWYYTYWSGVPNTDLILYLVPNRAMACIPTNDGLTCLPVAFPKSELREVRSDIAGNYMKAIELNSGLADLIHKGKREEDFVGMSDLNNFFRKSYGTGWALVGDAGYHKDPITGQGISDAFRQAEMIAEVLDAGLSGKEPMEIALAHYEQSRDEAVTPMYELTCDWAKLEPTPPEMEYLFAALRRNQTETNNFFGAMTGTIPIPRFFSPNNIQRIVASIEPDSKTTTLTP